MARFSGRQQKYWDIPGGRLDKGEYSEAVFRRKIKEELNFVKF